MVRRLLANDWFLVGVVVVAAVLRLAHLHALRSTVYFENLDLDPQSFDLWAQRIAAGEWPGDSPFFVDPLYSYVLGGLYSVFGRSLLLVRVLQAGLGVGTCLIVALIGRRLLGAALGNAAALVLALYRPAVFYDGELEKTTLSMFLFAAAVLALLRPTARSRLLAGVLLALAGLARGHLLVLAPFITGWLLLEQPGWGRAAWRMPACFAVAFLAVLAPVVAHNHRAGGGWAVTTSAGQNLYIGNNPLNEGGSYCYLPFVRANALFEEEDFHAEAETRVGRPLDAAAVSRFWADEALAHVRAHPGPAARMLARKLSLLLNDYELPDNQDMYFLARDSWVLRAPLPTFGWLLGPALAGMVVTWRRRDARHLAFLCAGFALSVILFFVQSRFRAPIVPLLAIFAVAGVDGCLRAPRFRRSALLAMLVVGGTLSSFRRPVHQEAALSFALSWQNLGALHARTGQTEDAIRAYRESIRLGPGNALAWRDLGEIFLEAGRPGDAEQALRASLEINPGDASAHDLLLRAQLRTR